MALNIKEALTKEALATMGLDRAFPLTKGGNINLLGAKSPLLALGGLLNIEGIKLTNEGRDAWKEFVKQAKNRFGVSEEDLNKFFAGTFSLVVNDNVTIEGIKLPAIYISQKDTNGAGEKIFESFEKSPHFHKVQDGVLQIDSSLIPAPCFVTKTEDGLGINLAELANISAATTLKPALKELMNTDATSALWLDFAEIQSWILSDENGVLTLLEPLARFSGQGEIFDAVKDVLSAKFSVPSMSIHSDSIEIIHTEFEIDEDVKAEDGLMSKLVKIGKKFLDFEKVESKPEENK